MCAVIVVVLCFVIGHINTLSIVDDDSMQHSFKTNFDRRFRNMEDNLSKVANRLDNYGRNLNHNVGAGSGDNYATRNGAPSHSNGANYNIQGSISNNGPQDGAPRRFNNGDYNFQGSRSNNEPQSGTLGRSNIANHNVQGSSNNYEPQDVAPSRSNNANNNFQDSSNNYRRQNGVLDPGQVNQIAPLSASDSNYGSYGAQNVADSGTAPLRNSRAHTKPRNCNVQAWNEKFDRIEGRLGLANSGSHSNPTVRCREETVVRGKDFGNGVVVHSTNTVGTGSYRSHVHRNVGDADAEALAKQFGSF